MPSSEPSATRNLDGYGNPPLSWQRVHRALHGGMSQVPGTGGPDRHTTWLTTINPDGSPHVTPLGVSSVGETWYFTSGPRTRKSRNIAADPRCVISVASHSFDLVVEGVAERVLDVGVLESVAAAYAADGWPARVDGDALTAEFNAPSAGPAPWPVYRLVPDRVFAVATAEPYGATRFDLPAGSR